MRISILFPLLVAACAPNLKGPCPEINATSIFGEAPDTPVAFWDMEGGTLKVQGAGFEALPQGINRRVDVPAAQLLQGDESVNAAVLYVDHDEVLVTVPVTEPLMAPGLWDLRLTNPSGCRARLNEALEIVKSDLDPSIVVSEIIPPFAWTESDTAITIVGSGFTSTPRAWLSSGGLVREHEITQVGFIDATSLIGVVPAGVPAGGPYDVIVENPDGGANYLEQAFIVTENAPPDIISVSPEAGETQNDVTALISGANFAPNAVVVLLDAEGNEVQAQVTNQNPDGIEALFPTSSDLSVGTWLVRVINPDGAWDTHAAFVVRNPSAKLGTAGPWTESNAMQRPRAGHTLLATTDDLGRGWLYAAGGTDGNSIHDTVERSQADVFGELGDWALLPTPMNVPRAHGAFAIIDGWLYAFGGEDNSGPVSSVERARLLLDEAAIAPTVTGATLDESGTLEAGTWYYRVAAVMDAQNADNPGGETPASPSYVVRADTAGSAITLTWDPLPDAATYRVYRTAEPDGSVGTERLIASDVVGESYTDSGDVVSDQTFLPEGALGTWQLSEEVLPGPWAHGALAMGVDPNGQTFHYLVGGTDGTDLIPEVWARTIGGTWFVAGPHDHPRVDNMASVCGYTQAPDLGIDSPDYLLSMNGDDGAGSINDGWFTEITAGGFLGAWLDMNNMTGGGNARVDGQGLCAAGHVYLLGGSRDESGAEDGGRQAPIEGPEMAMGSVSNTSADGTMVQPRADFSITQLRAMLYASGGRDGSLDATDTVEQVVF